MRAPLFTHSEYERVEPCIRMKQSKAATPYRAGLVAVSAASCVRPELFRLIVDKGSAHVELAFNDFLLRLHTDGITPNEEWAALLTEWNDA